MPNRTKHKTGGGGLFDQISGLVGRSGRRTRTGGGGLPGKAASFVAGFMSGGDHPRRRRAGGARRTGRRRR
jgi:hypothetical protein